MQATRILVTGASGLLGGHLAAHLRDRNIDYALTSGKRVDLSIAESARDVIANAKATIVIHTAAISAMSDCARDPETAKRVNVGIAVNLAEICASLGVRLVHVSTDLVFDGTGAPYEEKNAPSPVSTYGRTKAEAEHVLRDAKRTTIARLSLLFGPSRNSRKGFFDGQVASLREGRAMRLFTDEWRTPLSLAAAAEALIAIAKSDHLGTIHVGGPERMSRFEMGERLARFLFAANVPRDLLERASRTIADTDPNERRPEDVSLARSHFDRNFPGIATLSFEEELLRMTQS